MNLPLHQYSAFLFDLDGTIADSMPIHNLAWNQTLKVYGHQVTDELLQSYAGISTLKTVELFNERFKWTLNPESIFEEKEKNFLKCLKQVKVVEPVLNVLNLVKNKPIAIVSGGPRDNVVKMLKHLSLFEYFSVLVCAEDTLKGKPHPDPFLRAAELLKVNPLECLVFEDGESGIIGARACGMGVVKVTLKHELIFLE
jgi:HAD superfamily hydrolase (TIGR01509 family)